MPHDLASAFKAYDIRDLSPEILDSAFAKRLGKTIASVFTPKRVLVGRDMRLTSYPMETALVEGLTSCGVDVVRIGLCSTPLFNGTLFLANGEYDLGVMVTASHNPPKYNGFKLTRGNGLPIASGSGMEELRDAFLKDEHPPAVAHGRVIDDTTALAKYLDKVLALAKLPDRMPSVRVAIDAGNGMSGAVLPGLIERVPSLDVVPLFFELDGSFPNHEANPLKTETLVMLQKTVVSSHAAFGAAFDGDADRIGFVDEQGAVIAGDLMTAVLATELLRDQPGGLVYYDVRSSWAVSEAIAAAGGKSDMCRVGHAFIKQLMRDHAALFAGELSMHYYFHELGNFESGDLVLLLLAKMLNREQKKLSEVVAPLRRYAKIDETNFKVASPLEVIARLKQAYAPTATSVIEIDGLRCEFRDPAMPENDWWFNVRASNTEPLLRLNLEARNPAALTRRVAELTSAIQQHA